MYKEKIRLWLESEIINDFMKLEVKNITDEKELEDRFYKELEFGTAGIRGVIGAGINRMNIYTVGKATQALSNYLINNYKKNISVTIAYDSRNMSIEFAECSALVLAGNGIKVNLFEGLRSTPELSFAVRNLCSSAGIVITASHNPKEYNGYKVYGDDGCQITDEVANMIMIEMKKIRYKDIKKISKEEAMNKELINMIGDEIDEKYIDILKSYVIRKELVKNYAKDLKIIYTPIHGTGFMPVKRVLKELGYDNLYIVKEQEIADGNFPTAQYPNPESPQVFEIALEMGKHIEPDIIFGTDPDADRIGVVVKDIANNYKILTGNQIGILLTNYIITSLKEKDLLPKNGAVVKTIVTSEMIKPICDEYNINVFNVLTGFKYIGKKINDFNKSKKNKYLFGFEESYGYLFGEHARDKDAIVTAEMICEMALYYKHNGLNLYEVFLELCEKYGYYKEKIISIELKGKEGQEKIRNCLNYLREKPIKEVNNTKVKTSFDYKESIELDIKSGKKWKMELPKSNVLKYVLEDESWFVVRPSGTEPKMKIYLAVVSEDLEQSLKKIDELEKEIVDKINGILD